MGKHPVISISLKGINAASYEAAFELTVKTIKGAVQKAGFLKMSDKLGEDVKKIVEENTEKKTLGVFGEERVNVLGCNLDIAAAMGK